MLELGVGFLFVVLVLGILVVPILIAVAFGVEIFADLWSKIGPKK